MAKPINYSDILETGDSGIYDLETHAAGPEGSLPLTAEMLLNRPSGDVFGLTHNAAMGWAPSELRREEFLILSTQGGIRAPDGSPIALGYHTGHWEVGLLMQAVAYELKKLEGIPFAGYCSDPCDGRTQGTVGMMDSLAYRNDAAQIFRRLIRSLPTRKGVVGVATCDKGLPAMMMALAAMRELPAVLVPGGVTLPPTTGEDAGKIQTIGVRFAHGEISLQDAADMGCRACATAGGGCQFLGTAATSQVIGEALGMSLTHTALAPSGQKHLVGHGTPFRTRCCKFSRERVDDERYRYTRGDSERHGSARGIWWIYESSVAYSRDCACRRSSTSNGRRLDRNQSTCPAPR